MENEIKEALEKVHWNIMEHGYEIRSATTWLQYLLQENQRYREALETAKLELHWGDAENAIERVTKLINQSLKKEGESA